MGWEQEGTDPLRTPGYEEGWREFAWYGTEAAAGFG